MEKRFQWSKFTNGDRNEQFVIREDDWSLFVDGRNKVLALLGENTTNETTSKPVQSSTAPVKPVPTPNATTKPCPIHPDKRLYYNENGRFGPFWSHKTDQIGGNGKPIYCNGVDKTKPTSVEEYERVQGMPERQMSDY